uniref:Uncharacterized protein n=1 Tax=Romanomermis culicivorax TaxID=13658 RepID=A0A915ID77_ROMCU
MAKKKKQDRESSKYTNDQPEMENYELPLIYLSCGTNGSMLGHALSVHPIPASPKIVGFRIVLVVAKPNKS